MRTLFIISFMCIQPFLFAQNQLHFPLNHQQSREVEFIYQDLSVHQGLKPYVRIQKDSSIYVLKKQFTANRKYTKVWDKIINDDFVDFKYHDFFLKINPLFNLEVGNFAGEKLVVNTRAAEIKGGIGTRFAFYTSFYENQATYLPYIANNIERNLTVPGQGAAKIYEGKPFDFSHAESYIRFSANRFVNIEIGHGKHFVGHGYRSLLWSDNAFSMPYLQLDLEYKKLKYSIVYTELQDFVHKYYDYHTKKLSAFYYLSWLPTKNLEFGLFEGTIMHSSDGQTFTNKPDWAYFVPLIGAKTALYGFDDENNVVAGLNFRLSSAKVFSIYGQLAFDQASSKAYQLGLKANHVLQSFTNKHKLFLLAEYNAVPAEMYRSSVVHQNYSHYNQPLAHPYGNNFEEITAMLHYGFGRWFVDVQYTQSVLNNRYPDKTPQDMLLNLPAINIPTDLVSGTANLNYQSVKFGYMLLPATRLQIFGGFASRDYQLTTNNIQQYIFVGVVTAINNYYFDF